MLVTAVLGTLPAAAAFSTSEEERRKALYAYYMSGGATLFFDNIPNGALIKCPTIEKACTTAQMTDRVLGVTKDETVSTHAIIAFTGNNISTTGDLSSRTLEARLNVDRPDPQNRVFKHDDPIGWTKANRGKILCALYTILIGGAQLNLPAKTRFKQWHLSVGAPLEHVSKVYAERRKITPVSFAAIFDEADCDDEDVLELGAVLDVLGEIWPDGKSFSSANVVNWLGSQGFAQEAMVTTLRTFLAPGAASRGAASHVTPSAVTIGRRLKTVVDRPIERPSGVDLALRTRQEHKQAYYWIERKPLASGQ